MPNYTARRPGTRCRACRNGRHRTRAYSNGWPGPSSCPSLSSSFRRCCALSFNATSDPYPGDFGLGEKQLRPTFNDPGHYNGTLASRPAQRCSTNLYQPGIARGGGRSSQPPPSDTINAARSVILSRFSLRVASSLCFRKVIPILTHTTRRKRDRRNFFRLKPVLQRSPLPPRNV